MCCARILCGLLCSSRAQGDCFRESVRCGYRCLGRPVVLLYATLVFLPGIGIAYLTWKLSRNMRPILAQAIFRAGIFAIAITPAFWGHAGFLPAIFFAFVLHGRDRSDVIIEILIVWAIAIPVLLVRARNRKNATISVN
jgi:hypothetical protein